MICRNCNSEMEIDDRDWHFKGYEDIYWKCPNCRCCGMTEIRFGKQTYEEQVYNEVVIYRHKESELDGTEFEM